MIPIDNTSLQEQLMSLSRRWRAGLHVLDRTRASIVAQQLHVVRIKMLQFDLTTSRNFNNVERLSETLPDQVMKKSGGNLIVSCFTLRE